ncbi:unnamed protein product, partial [Allacma fusca]
MALIDARALDVELEIDMILSGLREVEGRSMMVSASLNAISLVCWNSLVILSYATGIVNVPSKHLDSLQDLFQRMKVHHFPSTPLKEPIAEPAQEKT